MSSEDLVKLEEEANTKDEAAETEGRIRLSVLDRNGDGTLSVEDIHIGLRDYLGLSVHGEEMTLATYIHKYADVIGTGVVTVDDFEMFCNGGLPKEFQPLASKTWTKAFPDPVENVPEAIAATTAALLAEEAFPEPLDTLCERAGGVLVVE
jgi:hypothetical protein